MHNIRFGSNTLRFHLSCLNSFEISTESFPCKILQVIVYKCMESNDWFRLCYDEM